MAEEEFVRCPDLGFGPQVFVDLLHESIAVAITHDRILVIKLGDIVEEDGIVAPGGMRSNDLIFALALLDQLRHAITHREEHISMSYNVISAHNGTVAGNYFSVWATNRYSPA